MLTDAAQYAVIDGHGLVVSIDAACETAVAPAFLASTARRAADAADQETGGLQCVIIEADLATAILTYHVPSKLTTALITKTPKHDTYAAAATAAN
mmetsp:Transcript_10728/g.35670  ORF Transcript_10728/g.35670 Transcript_10728/m.35670 type:complete len:96 (+) Transcript_10728:143-430(+)